MRPGLLVVVLAGGRPYPNVVGATWQPLRAFGCERVRWREDALRAHLQSSMTKSGPFQDTKDLAFAAAAGFDVVAASWVTTEQVCVCARACVLWLWQ